MDPRQRCQAQIGIAQLWSLCADNDAVLNPLDQGTQSIAGVNQVLGQALQDQLPPGMAGGSMSAAQDALGVNLAVTKHNHGMTLHSALLNVQNDSVKRLLENF